jgi:Ca2+-binding RTX toxin-like protein
MVKLRVSDDDGGHVDVQKTLNVTNEDPTVQIVGGAGGLVAEGTFLDFTADADDVNADTLTYQWTVKKNGVAGFASGSADAFSFTPNDNGTYEVNLTVSDEDGGVVHAGPVIYTAVNVAPTPETTTDDAVGARGQVRTLTLGASDPGSADVAAGFTYTVDWADGSAVQTFVPGTTQATHVFQNNGSYDVKVTVVDKDRALTDPAPVPQVVTMLTQSTALQGGILTVSGSANNDKLRLFMQGSSVAVENTTIGGSEYTVTYAGPITRIVVLGGDGNDHIDGTAMTIPMEVYGGDGKDLIETGSGADVIVGGGDDDRVAGNGGRDLLIGGRGKDRLLGDAEEDILIGGYTLLDASLNALRLISAEWTSGRTYEQRVANIRGPVTSGVNGTAFLRTGYNAFDDNEVDALAGDDGRDWFFSNADKDTARDKVVDATTMEELEEVNLE